MTPDGDTRWRASAAVRAATGRPVDRLSVRPQAAVVTSGRDRLVRSGD
ncbi:hypothetical protein [Streptomyces sp. NPDC006999]